MSALMIAAVVLIIVFAGGEFLDFSLPFIVGLIMVAVMLEEITKILGRIEQKLEREEDES